MSQSGLIDIEGSHPQIATQYDADSGSAVPLANVLEVLGGDGITTSGSGNTVTITADGGSDTACSNFIVDPSGTKSDYTTLTAAVAAASTDDTIFLKEGTYIEDTITISKNLTITAFSKSERNADANVIIQGTSGQKLFSISTLIDLTITNITVNSNNENILDLSTASSDCTFIDCRISVATGDIGFVNSGSSSNLTFNRCNTRGLGQLLSHTSSSAITWFLYSYLETSTTASTISAGLIQMIGTTCITPFTTTGGTITATHCDFARIGAASNTTWITTSASGSIRLESCNLTSGTSTTLSIGASTTANIFNCSLNSSNTNVIDGAGTINYAGLTFPGTSSKISTTTQTPLPTGPDIVVPDSITVGETVKDNTFTVNGASITGVIAQHTSGTTDLGGFVSERHSATAALGAHSLFLRTKGVEGSPTVVADDDVISRMVSCGYDGTDYAQAAEIRVEVDGTPGSDDMPGRIVMLTSADGAQTPLEALRITSEQFVGINTAAPLDNLHVTGSQRITHTSTENDDHALEIDCNAAGFGDVKALDIDYTTGAMTSVQDEEAILVNIDESASTGGIVAGYLVLSTAEGSATVNGYETGININPVVHQSGTFGDADSILNKLVDVTAALASGGAGAISIFVADNDTFTIGDAAQWGEHEIILATGASGAGVAPTFEYSTGGAGFSAFSPADGTNGFRNSGAILWDASSLAGWATATSGFYEVRITRTRNSLSTTPIIDELQISALTEYSWNKTGDVTVKSLVLTDDLVVAHGGTGASTLTGVLTGNGTSAVTANAVTQYGTVVAGASNAVSSVAPSATSGVPLISQGSSANPAYGTAVVAGGGSGATTLTGVLSGNGTSAFTASAVTDNTVVMGSTSNLLQNTTITVTDNGEMVNTSQPAFLAYLGTTDSAVTGDGTAFKLGDTDVGTTLTEVFDQNADFTPGASGGAIFTAPVTGRYRITFNIMVNTGSGNSTTFQDMYIVTSNRYYSQSWPTRDQLASFYGASNRNFFTLTQLCDMDTSDTVQFEYKCSGAATKVAGVITESAITSVSGQLEC